MSRSPRTALIMAGGTGGHVMPALAVAEALRAAGWRVVWLGTKSGMEAKLAVTKGFEMAWVRVAGVRGKGLITKLLLPFNLLIAFAQTWRLILRERPDVAVGLGGYVAFPGGMMAALLNKPLVIHEQNAIPGLTNRILAKLADRVLLGLPLAAGAAPLAAGQTWVGNPVRPAIAALPPPQERLGARAGPLRLLVIGGSLGATGLNDLVPKALALLPHEMRPVVKHQSGARHIETLRANYAAAGVEAEAIDFIDDMAAALAWPDVVICRAGALTVAENAAAGVAALYVPFPFAVDDHQTANAAFMADQDAGWLIQQRELDAEKLAAWLQGLDRAELLAKAIKARTLAKPNATASVVAAVEELTR